MGKNYYCDYCKKSFKDILTIRKNHIKSLQHQKAKNDHYAKYKNIKEIYLEESRKKTCKRILEGSTCNFGSQCRFSHFTPEQLSQMRRSAEEMEASREPRKKPNPENLNKFLQKTRDRILRDVCSLKPFWTYPYDLVEGIELPPSLEPLNPSLLPEKLEEWG